MSAGRLGTLAVVLGSGEVQLLPVPHPDHIGRAHAAAHQRPGPGGTGTAPPGELGAPRLVRLQPEASAAGSDLGGSLPSVAEWLPSAPHDLLLVRSQLKFTAGTMCDCLYGMQAYASPCTDMHLRGVFSSACPVISAQAPADACK